MLGLEHTHAASTCGWPPSLSVACDGRVADAVRRLARPSIGLWLLALCLIALLGGCASKGPAPVGGWDWVGPVPDGYYLIRRGDTLSEVATRHGVGVRTLADWNGLESPYSIYAGRLLRVVPPDGSPAPQPSAAQGAPAVVAAPAPATPQRAPQATGTSNAAGNAAKAGPAAASGLSWTWPLEGSLAQRFSAGDRTRQGIRIRGRAGEQVKAAGDGQVVYSGGGLKGYGNLIIIKHNDKYLSAYGFNRRLLAAEGDRVKRGQAVAEVGQAVDGGGYLLHFEIRRDGTAVDPLLYLPPRR
ncbi:peptidoglycan DD-metalloendopeptidase family protein [Thiocapsa roseopersicina]|uniref:Lipoprotein NlpD n=1 Tax=Thiocapsa roseopersicina TaxID=1058 RepID=A0A1H2Q2J1_THIRO|nr:peptidoglycan DD-metalloendopeptidase family protein [Thiocapsa roseopersicina]SDW00689.1 lipoprotein NlpD [Thiocapsa roseopersicina]